jgi:hypothetical protein
MKHYIFSFVIIFIFSIAFSATINICFSVDNSLSSEEMYEGYTLAVRELASQGKNENFNFINLTKTSTNASNLNFLLNGQYAVVSDESFLPLIEKANLRHIIVSFPTSTFSNPYPSPKDEVKLLIYQLKDSSRFLFIYNSNPYAYQYLKALENISGKTIFVKKYSYDTSGLDQMVNKNSIDTIVAFLNPIQTKNLMKSISERQNRFISKVKIVALSVYDYFDYILNYSDDYDGLYFFSILNNSLSNPFVKSYKKVFGHLPTQLAAASFDSLLMMNAYINKDNHVNASSRILMTPSGIQRPIYFYKVDKGVAKLQAILKY